MERLVNNESPRGLSAAGLRMWGFLFLAAGAAGKGLIQNGWLGITAMKSEEMLQLLEQSGDAMFLTTVSLILQALESCAVPLFAFLLVEGFRKCERFQNYLLQVALVAIVSEIPYNLTFGTGWLDTGSRNPAFGLVLCLVMLWFFRYLDQRQEKSTLLKLVVAAAALIWCQMLGIEHGAFAVLLTAVLWWMWGKRMRTLAGCGAAAVGTLFSMFNVVSPMSFFAIHMYNGEDGDGSRIFELACYPLMLILFSAAIYLL